MSAEVQIIHEPCGDIPIVELRQVLRSGSATEPEGLEGVGRLALRLLRRGAAGKGRKDIDEALDRIAAALSAQSSTDFYAIHLRVLRRFLDPATALLAEVLHRPTLDPEELDRLKRETVAEIVSSRDDDRFLAARGLRLGLFPDHPYGRPSRGTVESVARIGIEDVRRFLDEHLVRRNLLVGAAGDLTADEVRAAIDRTGGALPDRPPPSIGLADPAMPRGVRVVLIDKPDRTQTQMYVGHIGPRPGDRLDLALRVALTAFGGTFTSRLMREVRVNRGWSYGAYASLGRARLPEVLSLWTFPKVEDAPACLRLVLDLYGELASAGPTAEDLEFARGYMARSFALQKDTAAARLTLSLREKLLDMEEGYYDTFADRVRAVTLEEARAAVAAHVQTRDLVVSISCTAGRLEGELRSVLGEDATFEVIPYDSPLL